MNFTIERHEIENLLPSKRQIIYFEWIGLLMIVIGFLLVRTAMLSVPFLIAGTTCIMRGFNLRR